MAPSLRRTTRTRSALRERLRPERHHLRGLTLEQRQQPLCRRLVRGDEHRRRLPWTSPAGRWTTTRTPSALRSRSGRDDDSCREVGGLHRRPCGRLHRRDAPRPTSRPRGPDRRRCRPASSSGSTAVPASGLSTCGDAVNLFDALGNRITGVSFGASAPASRSTTRPDSAARRCRFQSSRP